MIAYHLSSSLLEPGAKILPGNWGRMLMLYTQSDNMRLLLRETIYEQVRKERFPDRPSRLRALFCCPSADGALMFRNINDRWFDMVYQVELEEQNLFYASWRHADIEAQNQSPVLDALENQANLYWASDWKSKLDETELEILSPDPCVIIKRIMI